jgi:hypothetical protein
MPKDNQALSLLTVKSDTHVSLLPEMPRIVGEKLGLIRAADRQQILLAFQIGALLWRTKASLKHGEFQDWIRTNVDGRGYRSCARYMKLTLRLAEERSLSDRGWTALLDLHRVDDEALSGAEAEAAEAVSSFARDLSLTELMVKHGIMGVGLKSELTSEEPPALTAEQQQQQELALIWEQTYTPAKTLADVLTEKAGALNADQRSALESELNRALDILRRA